MNNGYRPEPSDKPRGSPPQAINANPNRKVSLEILIKIANDPMADGMARVEACKVLLENR